MTGTACGGLVVVDRDPHELGAGMRQLRDLDRRRVGVGGVGVRHRLHDDRVGRPDRDVADQHRRRWPSCGGRHRGHGRAGCPDRHARARGPRMTERATIQAGAGRRVWIVEDEPAAAPRRRAVRGIGRLHFGLPLTDPFLTALGRAAADRRGPRLAARASARRRAVPAPPTPPRWGLRGAWSTSCRHDPLGREHPDRQGCRHAFEEAMTWALDPHPGGGVGGPSGLR